VIYRAHGRHSLPNHCVLTLAALLSLSLATAPADACGDFYSASLYDRGADIYLSIQINRFRGFGFYPALSVRSLASLAVGNSGTTRLGDHRGRDVEDPGRADVSRDDLGLGHL